MPDTTRWATAISARFGDSLRKLKALHRSMGSDFGPIKIALADDNRDARKTLSALLALMGHEVVCQAENGAELLRTCFEGHVDVVISDLDMPIIDGLEAAEEIAEKGIPVILLSGHPDLERVNLAHEPLAARLLKPVTLDSLRAALVRALKHRSDRRS